MIWINLAAGILPNCNQSIAQFAFGLTETAKPHWREQNMSFGFLEFAMMTYVAGSCALGILIGKSIKSTTADAADDQEMASRPQNSFHVVENDTPPPRPKRNYYARQAEVCLSLAEHMRHPASARVLRSAATDYLERARLSGAAETPSRHPAAQVDSPPLHRDEP